MEEFIMELKKKFKADLWYKAYADDLVFIVKYDQVERLINDIFELSKEMNLKVNPKKSCIMAINNHKLCQ